MRVKPPKKIIVEAGVADSPLASSLMQRLPDAEFQIVDRIPERMVHDPDTLEIVSFRGRFLKSCPGTRHYFCCGYRILHFGIQCTIGCTYCILQAYLNEPNLRLFGNIDGLFEELAGELGSHPDRLFRIGTGEFTDSLLLDPWTDFSRLLIPFFARQTNAILELKTKTPFVENLLDMEHGGHTIVAWSLNADRIRRREEGKAAALSERFEAAHRCAERGYWLAFHFDPMIEHPDWRKGYGRTLERLFESIDPSRVVWISLGGFRFMPDLKPIIQSKHPKSLIPYGEFVRGLDGKMRYFRDIRVELYSFMVEYIRKIDPQICVYLCMEGRDIWRQAFGYSPDERGGLALMLDRAVQNRMKVGLHCGESQDFP